MEFVNHTRLPALLVRGIINREQLFGSLVVRACFSLKLNEGLKLSDDQPWKTSSGPWESPAGLMPGDELFYRQGVDVFVLGNAVAQRGKPATRLSVGVAIGEQFQHRVLVHGNRRWEKRGARLVATEPEPFTTLPLTLANAYGGKDVWDELPIPFPDNPDGKGYFLEEQNAAGKPLPNIEDPAKLIRQWNDQPEPVGMAIPPQAFGPRLRRAVEFDPATGQLSKLSPLFYNHAFPAMVAPKTVKFGDLARFEGVFAGGPVEFLLPQPWLEVRLRFGKQVTSISPAIDQLGIEPDRQRLFITYRHPFRYRLVPMEKRSCELFAQR